MVLNFSAHSSRLSESMTSLQAGPCCLCSPRAAEPALNDVAVATLVVSQPRYTQSSINFAHNEECLETSTARDVYKNEKYCTMASMNPIYQRCKNCPLVIGTRAVPLKKQGRLEPLSPTAKTERYYRVVVQSNNVGKSSVGSKNASRPPKAVSSPTGEERRSILKPTRSQLMKTAQYQKRLKGLSKLSKRSASRPDARMYTKLYTKNSSFQGTRRVSNVSIQLTEERNHREPKKTRLDMTARNAIDQSRDDATDQSLDGYHAAPDGKKD